MANISLVIINDNGEEYCPLLFNSISAQEVPVELDLVFVDNCSSDKSIQIAQSFGINKIFRFDSKEEHRGVLYNKGAEMAEGDYVVFAHCDIFFAPDFFKLLLVALEDSRVGTFTCFGEYYADTRFVDNEKLGIIVNDKKIFYKQLFENWFEDRAYFMECSEACFMVKREVFTQSRFNEIIQNSFFEYFFLMDVIANDGSQSKCNECQFTHYFIELHEKTKTYENDYKLLEGSVNKYQLIFAVNQHLDIKNLKHQNTELNNQIVVLNNRIAEQNNQIAEQSNQITELNNQIAVLNTQIASAHDENIKLWKCAESLSLKNQLKKYIKKILRMDRM